MPTSVRVPAESVLHIFRALRPGQVRGPSWFAPVLLRFKDFDEFEDATLMKQKIAACLAVLTTDPNGSAESLGTVSASDPMVDMISPGAVLNLAPGRTVDVVNPPRVDEYEAYSKTVLRAIATGLGVTYEDLTGDYQDMPFSAARMSRLRHWAHVEDWRWRILIPQFCDPVWQWAMEAAAMQNLVPAPWPDARWSAPPPPMVDPDKEGLAAQRLVRSGLSSLSEILRERGLDPAEVFAEIAADNAALDRLGLVLDSDPRKMTQAGQAQQVKVDDESFDADDEVADDARRARLRLARRG
jgi:lambda family phage portal protein